MKTKYNACYSDDGVKMLGNEAAATCTAPCGSARVLISNRMTVTSTRGKILALGHTSATSGTRVVLINISHHKYREIHT